MQSSGSINQDYINIIFLCIFYCIKSNCRGIRAVIMFYDLGVEFMGVFFKLLSRFATIFKAKIASAKPTSPSSSISPFSPARSAGAC